MTVVSRPPPRRHERGGQSVAPHDVTLSVDLAVVPTGCQATERAQIARRFMIERTSHPYVEARSFAPIAATRTPASGHNKIMASLVEPSYTRSPKPRKPSG